MKPSKFYKKYGAKGTTECATMMNRPPKTLENWTRTNPELAEAIALYCSLDEEQRQLVSKLKSKDSN